MGRKDLDAKTREILERLDRDRDARTCYLALNETLDAFRTSGAPIPEPLAAAKRHLEWELAAQSQGR